MLRTLPSSPGGDVTTHADLIPGNVLLASGRLTGVIDVGGLVLADPALDLVAARHLSDLGHARRCGSPWAATTCSGRGAVWALQEAPGVGWHYVDSNPAMSAMALQTLERLTPRDAVRRCPIASA